MPSPPGSNHHSSSRARSKFNRLLRRAPSPCSSRRFPCSGHSPGIPDRVTAEILCMLDATLALSTRSSVNPTLDPTCARSVFFNTRIHLPATQSRMRTPSSPQALEPTPISS